MLCYKSNPKSFRLAAVSVLEIGLTMNKLHLALHVASYFIFCTREWILHCIASLKNTWPELQSFAKADKARSLCLTEWVELLSSQWPNRDRCFLFLEVPLSVSLPFSHTLVLWGSVWDQFRNKQILNVTCHFPYFAYPEAALKLHYMSGASYLCVCGNHL